MTGLAFAAISICGTGNKLLAAQDSIISPVFTVEENSWVGSDVQTIDDYLNKYIRYPEASGKKKQMRTAIIEFVVTTEGEVKVFHVINSVSKAIDEEMVRVLAQTGGMWEPGLLNGMPVPMKKEVSLVFVKIKQLEGYEELNEALEKNKTGEIE